MNEILSFGGLTALTIGLTEVVKRIGVPERFIPITAVVIGIILTSVGDLTNLTTLSVLTGIACGLSAVGLYSGVKNTVAPTK